MALKVSELAAKFAALAEVVTKIATEIQALKDSLANAEIPAEAQTALDNLDAALKAADDLNTDAA